MHAYESDDTIFDKAKIWSNNIVKLQEIKWLLVIIRFSLICNLHQYLNYI